MKKSAAAFSLGAVSVAGFSPFDLPFVTVLALAGLIALWLDDEHPGWTGFCFGLGLFLFGVSWIYVSLHDFGGMPMPIALLATLLFCAFLSLYPAAAGKIQSKIPASPFARAVFVIPSILALTDWVRGWLFTGFPWLSLGYSQTNHSPLSGFAPIFGVYGISLLCAACAGLLYAIAKPLRRKTSILLLFAILSIGLLLGKIEWTRPSGSPVTVSLLQGNIPQNLKWTDSALQDTLDTYMKMVLASKSRLIILPETAIPLFYTDVPPGYLDMFEAHAKKNGGDVVTGLAEQLPYHEKTYYNSVFDFGVSQSPSYRKSHLVPFGEYVPIAPVFGWLFDLMNMPMSDFSAGSIDQKPMQAAGERLAVDICYEDVFGEEVIRQLPRATMLVNVSDDAWFGDSIAPRQHLEIAQMRTLETGRMMLRSTNTGMTAIIDRNGKVVKQIPPFEERSLDGFAQGYSGYTPYIFWGNHAFLFLAALMLLPGLAKFFRKK